MDLFVFSESHPDSKYLPGLPQMDLFMSLPGYILNISRLPK